MGEPGGEKPRTRLDGEVARRAPETVAGFAVEAEALDQNLRDHERVGFAFNRLLSGQVAERLDRPGDEVQKRVARALLATRGLHARLLQGAEEGVDEVRGRPLCGVPAGRVPRNHRGAALEEHGDGFVE